MEITVEKMKVCDDNYFYDGYTVHVGDHRILTISTDCYATATKWLKGVHKSHRNKHGTLVVGVCADRKHLDFERGGLKDSPYDLLQLCVGSQCLIYNFTDSYTYATPKSMQEFFADRRVVAVGRDMAAIAKKLEKDHDIKVANPVDLNSLAVEGMRRDYLDLQHYDLDRLATVVLGKDVYVFRPENHVEWYEGRKFFCYRRELTCEKVKYATFDPYLCFLIGSKLLDMINSSSPVSSSSSSSNKKKKMKNKK